MVGIVSGTLAFRVTMRVEAPMRAVGLNSTPFSRWSECKTPFRLAVIYVVMKAVFVNQAICFEQAYSKFASQAMGSISN